MRYNLVYPKEKWAITEEPDLTRDMELAWICNCDLTCAGHSGDSG